jgi:thiamine kinase-like enzyme
LRHFEQVGFGGAPRFLGIDEEGREILSFVEGEPALAPVPAEDDVVAEIGRLLRGLHDAQVDFVPTVNAGWQLLPGEPASAGEVICHNDLFWPNVIFRSGRPVALIDWDLAAPGLRLQDVGLAAGYWVPLRTDGQALAWGLPVDRRAERLQLLCDAYGLDADSRSRLLDVHLRRRQLGYEAHRIWGGLERRLGWREMWDADHGAELLANLAWIAAHRETIESWL